MWVCLKTSICNKFKTVFTGRNEVLAKVIFSQACVKNSVHREGGGLVGGVSNFSGGFSNFSGGGVYGQRSAGTHPTGMHSCYT